jgi:hypothetical protein
VRCRDDVEVLVRTRAEVARKRSTVCCETASDSGRLGRRAVGLLEAEGEGQRKSLHGVVGAPGGAPPLARGRRVRVHSLLPLLAPSPPGRRAGEVLLACPVPIEAHEAQVTPGVGRRYLASRRPSAEGEGPLVLSCPLRPA